MAATTTVYSDLVTNFVATPQVKNTSKLFKGKTSRICASYTAAALSTGIIQMIPVQAGDVVVGGRVYWGAQGASTSITVGDSGDTDRFMTTAPTVSASANGVVGAAGSGTGFFNTIGGVGYEYTAAGYISVYGSDAAHTGAITLVVDLNHQ